MVYIKVERQLHDMQMAGRIAGVHSTEQFVWHQKRNSYVISWYYLNVMFQKSCRKIQTIQV